MLLFASFCLWCCAFDVAFAVKGGKAPTITLNDGNVMPVLGLGTFLGFNEKVGGMIIPQGGELSEPMKWAVDAGYRLFDTASAYDTEGQVGAGVAASGLKRDDVFICTKLGTNEQRDVTSSLRKSLSRLNTTYVDLYLIHNPISFTPDHKSYDNVDYVDTWKQMEQVKEAGLAKSIGVSNFNVSQMQRLLEHAKVKPAVLQIEVNLNLDQNELVNFCKSHNITVMAYTPFGSMFDKDKSLPAPRADDPALVNMAQKYGKTVPQIVLRYLVQRGGIVPIPKSIHKDRIEQNIDIFDFELTPSEMESLGKYNANYRTVLPTFWQDHPYYPFERTDKLRQNVFQIKTD